MTDGRVSGSKGVSEFNQSGNLTGTASPSTHSFPAPGPPKTTIRVAIWIPGIFWQLMRSSPSSSPGHFCHNLLTNSGLKGGGRVLKIDAFSPEWDGGSPWR